MSNYNLTTEQLNMLRNLTIQQNEKTYKFHNIILTNKAGEQIEINSKDVRF